MELAQDRKEEKGRLSLGCVPTHLPYVTVTWDPLRASVFPTREGRV